MRATPKVNPKQIQTATVTMAATGNALEPVNTEYNVNTPLPRRSQGVSRIDEEERNNPKIVPVARMKRAQPTTTALHRGKKLMKAMHGPNL
jgi:hypothetical protein